MIFVFKTLDMCRLNKWSSELFIYEQIYFSILYKG